MWKVQWELYAKNFHHGRAHIPLDIYGIEDEVLLLPGPGFGDFSHPTTRLTLKLASPLVKGKKVADIGCGSGILTFAALKLGAKEAFGIDIDPEAIDHAQKSCKINHLNPIFALAHEGPAEVILFNMIASEQERAYETNRHLFEKANLLITSGILAEAKESYLSWIQSKNWELVEEAEEEGWMAFVLKKAAP